MPTDYEKVYQQKPHALGDPTPEFVNFFNQYNKQRADVLDIGCGQGRDALFIARQGHHVLGVDIAVSGITQMLEEAQAEGLNMEGVVADLRHFEPAGKYDVVVIDRTLHMLAAETRLEVLWRISRSVRVSGIILIADQRSNLPSMRKFFEADNQQWAILKDKKGFLFVQKGAPIEPQ